MNVVIILPALCVAIPLLATMRLRLRDEGFSERHHSHHDTYVVSISFTWAIMLAMIVMGVLGNLLGWLCSIGAYEANYIVVMGFFDVYLLTSFLYWVCLVRYKVVTYDDRMEVTPFIGRKARIPYKDITAMTWVPSILMQGRKSLRVYVGKKQRALLWSGLDLDQILIRINRFDKLEEYVAKS